jgi:hypothetical protein
VPEHEAAWSGASSSQTRDEYDEAVSFIRARMVSAPACLCGRCGGSCLFAPHDGCAVMSRLLRNHMSPELRHEKKFRI